LIQLYLRRTLLHLVILFNKKSGNYELYFAKEQLYKKRIGKY